MALIHPYAYAQLSECRDSDTLVSVDSFLDLNFFLDSGYSAAVLPKFCQFP